MSAVPLRFITCSSHSLVSSTRVSSSTFASSTFASCPSRPSIFFIQIVVFLDR